MECPEPAVVEAAGRGVLLDWPPGLEEHLDGCAACMARLVEIGARSPDDDGHDELGTDDGALSLPPMPTDRYEFLGELGRGGQSRVLRAYDRLLRHEVAFKQFVPRGQAPGSDALARDRFVREVGIMADLGHPGVIPILDLGLRDGWPYCTMQVVEGQTLTQARRDLDDDPAGRDRLLSHFVAICEAVDFAHRLGIVHRDLKPDNIMFGRFGQAYVLDWALAKRLSDPTPPTVDPHGRSGSDPGGTQAGMAVGTPAYMSPEHLGAESEADIASDIWSLGAVLFFIVTGRAPIEGSDLPEVMQQVRSAHREGLPGATLAPLPRELRAIVARAMSPSREDRYADARAIARDVEAYRTDRPVSVVRYSAAARAARLVRHHPTLVVATLVVLLVTTMGLVITLRALQRESAAHAQTAGALRDLEQAQGDAGRSQMLERRQAARVRASLVQARADRAAQLRDRHRVLSARAHAGSAVAEAAPIRVEQLDPSERSSLAWALARARGEILLGQTDVVRSFASQRPLGASGARHVVEAGGVYTAWSDGEIMEVHRLATGERVAQRPYPAPIVGAISLSPSGRRAVMITRAEAGPSTITTWSLDGAQLREWTVPVKHDGLVAVSDAGVVAVNSPADVVLALHPDREVPIALRAMANWALAFSPDGSRLAISGNEGDLVVIDPRDGSDVMTCDRHAHRLTALAFDQDARRLVAGCVGGDLVVCSASLQEVVPVHQGRVTAVELSDDGRLAFSAGMDNTIGIVDVDADRVIGIVDAPRRTVFEIAFDPDHGTLHAFTADEVIAWEVDPAVLPVVRPIAFQVHRQHAFDGERFLVAHGLQPLLLEIDPRTGHAQARALPDAEPPANVYVRPGGEVLTIAFSGRVYRWTPGDDGLEARASWDGENANINGTALFGDLLAMEHDDPRGIALWRVDTGERVALLSGHERAVFSVAFSRDGTRLASGDSGGRIIVWDVPRAAAIATVQEAGAPIFDLAFDRDSGLIAASDDGVRRWPTVQAREPQPLDTAHGYRMLTVDDTHHRLAALRTSKDRIVVWDLEAGEVALDLTARIGVSHLDFSPDGRILYWLSSRRMASVSIPPPAELATIDGQAEDALRAARSERLGLLRWSGHDPR